MDFCQTRLQVRLEHETVWLTQQMAGLCQTTKQNVSLQVQNIFSEGELQENLLTLPPSENEWAL